MRAEPLAKGMKLPCQRFILLNLLITSKFDGVEKCEPYNDYLSNFIWKGENSQLQLLAGSTKLRQTGDKAIILKDGTMIGWIRRMRQRNCHKRGS